MSQFLIIDTATKPGSISLMIEEKIDTIWLEEKNQTKEIIPVCEKLFKKHGIKLSDLSGIAICIGPGTYTGTRVGVMTAKTLSYATDVPLYPFTTFDLFKDKSPYAAIDAKCKRAYLFDGKKISLITHKDLSCCSGEVYAIDTTLDGTKSTTKVIENLITILAGKSPQNESELTLIYPDKP